MIYDLYNFLIFILKKKCLLPKRLVNEKGSPLSKGNIYLSKTTPPVCLKLNLLFSRMISWCLWIHVKKKWSLEVIWSSLWLAVIGKLIFLATKDVLTGRELTWVDLIFLFSSIILNWHFSKLTYSLNDIKRTFIHSNLSGVDLNSPTPQCSINTFPK
jgi:hypothetical protein